MARRRTGSTSPSRTGRAAGASARWCSTSGSPPTPPATSGSSSAPTAAAAGSGTEATTLLLRYAFEDLRLHRVSLGVYAFNPRARHVYEKAGFVVEGVDREALLFDGRRVDMIRMAVLAPEWSARRGR